MAAEIYISKRCEYCMKLLIELKGRPDLKGSIKIISIDDEPFPNIIKTVPTMISDGQLFTAKQIFDMLEESKEVQHANNQRMESHGQQGQGQGQGHGQGQQNKGQEQGSSDELSGYCDNGMCLGFSPLEGGGMDSGNFATIDDKEGEFLNVKNDGYSNQSKKSADFDSDYEKLLSERGNMMPGRPPVR